MAENENNGIDNSAEARAYRNLHGGLNPNEVARMAKRNKLTPERIAAFIQSQSAPITLKKEDQAEYSSGPATNDDEEKIKFKVGDKEYEAFRADKAADVYRKQS